MKDLLLHNWHLKIVSLVLATALWAAVARQPSSEIGFSVSLEYQNFPDRTAVLGDLTDRVEVRLRGSSSLLRTLTAQDVYLPLDVEGFKVGQEKVVSLRPDMVHAPFGVDVVRVYPSQVTVMIAPIITKRVKIEPKISGHLQPGFAVEKTVVTPDTLELEGPENRLASLDTISSTVIDVEDKRSTFRQTVDLDISDPVIRVVNPRPVNVEVVIRRSNP
jgi:YbbR domain-containing protein